MRKPIILAGAFAVLLLSSSFCTASLLRAGRQETAAPPAEPAPIISEEYIIREYSGKIAVFRKTETTPFAVYNVFITTLPEYDQAQLKAGVSVKDKAQLNRLIEDYTS